MYRSIKEEIKSAVDIVELIGEYVPLKKAGQNIYVGPCPFHYEANYSLTVNRPKAIFHCFECKKGGDVFAFWMEYYKVSFIEAMKDLAEKYNIELNTSIFEPQKHKQRQRAHSVCEGKAETGGCFHT